MAEKTDREVIQEFANKHKIIFDDEGECGFGRKCVGLKVENWIDYNPCDYGAADDVEAYCDERLNPPEGVTHAYHKHNCMAVLGRGDEAIRQLAIWVRHYESVGVEVVDRPRRFDSQIALLLHGAFTPTFRVKEATDG